MNDGAFPCPHCRAPLAGARAGGTPGRECAACGGVWLDVAALDALCADPGQQAKVLAMLPAAQAPADVVRYRPCPACGELMHRVNVLRDSGIIVDSCRAHGTWFDADELRRTVRFVQGGGLQAARERDRAAAEAEHRQKEQDRLDDHDAGLADSIRRLGRMKLDLLMRLLGR